MERINFLLFELLVLVILPELSVTMPPMFSARDPSSSFAVEVSATIIFTYLLEFRSTIDH